MQMFLCVSVCLILVCTSIFSHNIQLIVCEMPSSFLRVDISLRGPDSCQPQTKRVTVDNRRVMTTGSRGLTLAMHSSRRSQCCKM